MQTLRTLAYGTVLILLVDGCSARYRTYQIPLDTPTQVGNFPDPSDPSTPDPTDPTPTDPSDPGTPDPNPMPPTPQPLANQYTVEACKGMNGVAEGCYWRYLYNDQKCSVSSRCSKLVLYFSGGEMSCDDSFNDPTQAYSKVLKQFADNGYVAVCIGLFVNSDGAGEVPYYEEAPRVDASVKAVVSSSVVKSLWDGQHLLFAGVSHGATAPVLAMARTTYDDQDEWKGTKTTGACFHDGIYDIPALNALQKTDPIVCYSLRNRNICNRYYGTNGCADPQLSEPDIAMDTITATPASAFAIPKWKLIECGSQLPPCAALGDWIPAGPIQTLCQNLDADSARACTFGSQPQDAHVTCPATPAGLTSCQTWFDGQLNP